MQSNIFKLEVGNSYKTREGDARVKIIGCLGASNPEHKTSVTLFPFVGDDGLCYDHSGRFCEMRETPFDLLIDNAPIESFQIELGGIYKTRDGKTTILIVDEHTYHRKPDDTTPVYPFRGSNGCRYSKTGAVFEPFETPFDLTTQIGRDPTVQETKLQLTVGKTYRTRNGDNHITIVGEASFHHEDNDNSKIFPFLGNDGVPYTAEGRFFREFESEHDLVEEVDGTTFRLQVGKRYETRDGSAVVEIISTDEQLATLTEDNRPFVGDNEEYYGESGNFNFDPTIESEFDLIKEVE